MTLQTTGYLEDSLGRKAEELVLEVINNHFQKDYTRVFINHEIPQGNPPDFVIPVIDREGKFKILIVECKGAKEVFIDGSTKFKDTFDQVTKFRDALIDRLRPFKKECEVECLVVHPDKAQIPSHLFMKGRDGIRWMTLNDFKAHILKYQAVGPYSHHYQSVQMIYSQKDLLQKIRFQYNFSKEQERILGWGFGKVKKIGGLAGTGKSLLLARKLINDIKKSKCTEFLYLTHNKNLVFKFTEYLEDFLILDGLNFEVETIADYSKKVQIEMDGRKVYIHLYNFDRFSTQCVTKKIDKILPRRWEGEFNLHSLVRRIRSESGLNEHGFKKEREKLISLLSPIVSEKPQAYQLFDALYIDEFQDCRIDPSRFLLPALFVRRTDGEINLTFSEDPLQSYVKFSVLQELDDSFAHSKRKDFANYEDLGLPARLPGRVEILHHIYRTPEKIFHSALNLLEYHGGLLKNNKSMFSKLVFPNKFGAISFVDQIEVDTELARLMNDKQRFPHEIIIIERMFRSACDRVVNQLKTQVFIPKSSEAPAKDKLNVFNELNVRGLESLCVFIIVDEQLVKQPNFIYTLMCRTQRYLYLVKAQSLGQSEFDEFKNSLILETGVIAS